MTTRPLHLLSPYRLPTSYPLQMGADEVAAWLNGYAALWHPAALAGSAAAPATSNTYDHDTPLPGAVYCVPQGPHLYQPDDWRDRVRAAGAVAFAGTAARRESFANLKDALAERGEAGPLFDVPDDVVRLFTGLGYGYLLVDSLYEAQDHDRLLDAEGFWSDVSDAVKAATEGGDVRPPLSAAAEKLRVARESLYPGAMFLLDWVMPDPKELDAPWPASLAAGIPLTLLASAETLEQLQVQAPERFAELKAKIIPGLPPAVDVCCGAYREREDALLPFESQWWNLRRAREVTKALFGVDPAGYARRKSAYHPQLPSWLQHFGYRHAVLISFDQALIPTLRSTAVNWPGPDGKGVDAFTREPLPAHDPQTFFNLAYHLHQATSSDAAPTVALIHKGQPAAAGYADLLALAELAPVLGNWTGLARYFTDAVSGDYIGTQPADEFFADYLDDRVTHDKNPTPVTGFPRQLRLRRRLDSAFTLAALHHSLTPGAADLAELTAVENDIEARGVNPGPDSDDALSSSLARVEAAWATKLAERIQARSTDGQPGVLVFNPCGFTRRAALELDGFPNPVPVADPIKFAEFAGGRARLVVELPPLGFAWLPRTGNAAPPKPKLKTADGLTVRNEFFEADVDAATGGLRSFRDLRTRTTRFGQQLVFNPGSSMKARSVTVTNAGAALGEIVSEGDILDPQNEVIATFRQRFRAWMGRPVLEVRVELDVKHRPSGYPWHSYYGARFGWRDDRAVLFRGVNGQNTLTGYTRPVSPDYLEVRLGSERSFLFTGGLPFLQRHGSRMIDVVLSPEGETGSAFELLLALDREQPMQTAVGWVSPAPVVVTEKGPPAVGASGWLAHVDMPSLVLTSLRPADPGEGMNRAVVGQFVECAGFGGAAEIRFARDPSAAARVDGNGAHEHTLGLVGDAIPVDFSAGEKFRVKAEWA
ncbi:hypothetical protein [Urbifossiella limnaea]|uniref:Glycoside hydrolase family 38 N-terminal domain-containing protein n=1 Tax=Urbifossiella limnaea TaxID=2528023 RepID=A0A517Y124_9BACT|nr:hypothetical protein [Urbifossiella limnaea]QDU23444.1 hypothetical protein ETAA1_54440 [Urbifossiella limnaea]